MHQINNSVDQDTSRSSYILSDHRNVLTVRLFKPVRRGHKQNLPTLFIQEVLPPRVFGRR